MSVVRLKREAAGLGQEELARQAKISVFKLQRIEHGKQPLHEADAIALSQVLRCNPLELLPKLKEAVSMAQAIDVSEEPAHA